MSTGPRDNEFKQVASAALVLSALDHDLEVNRRREIITPEAYSYGWKYRRIHTAGGSHNKKSGSNRKAAKAAKKARKINRGKK